MISMMPQLREEPSKRLIRPMPGFKSFRPAAETIAGIQLMHMIRMGWLLKCAQHSNYIR
jgi:transposase-like protein